MGIYFKNIDVLLSFNGEVNINEDYFTKPVAHLKIGIDIRDCTTGRSGKISPHTNSPSIKVSNYGAGKRTNHSKDGDPVYFTNNGSPITGYEAESKFTKLEKEYIRNFIYHNYLNLMIYWFAPEKCESRDFCKELQHEVTRRIQQNINKIDYSKISINKFDDKVKISERVRKRLGVSRNTIDI